MSGRVLKNIWKGTNPEYFESTKQDTHRTEYIFMEIRTDFFSTNVIKENPGYFQKTVEPVNGLSYFA